MFTLHLTAANKSQGQRIMILQVVLALLKRNNRLWPVKIVNYETTRKSFVLCTRRQSACENVYCLKRSAALSKK